MPMDPYLAMLQDVPAYQRLKAQGFTDEEILGGSAGGGTDSTMRLGGGSAFLGPAVSLAGITSNYNLGRGNLAATLQEQEYNRQANPFNVVTALQQYADNGQSDMLNNPILKNIAPGPASRYGNYLGSMYDPASYPNAAGGAPAPVASAAPNAVGQSWIDAWRAYHPGQPDPVQDYAPAAALGTGKSVV